MPSCVRINVIISQPIAAPYVKPVVEQTISDHSTILADMLFIVCTQKHVGQSTFYPWRAQVRNLIHWFSVRCSMDPHKYWYVFLILGSSSLCTELYFFRATHSVQAWPIDPKNHCLWKHKLTIFGYVLIWFKRFVPFPWTKLFADAYMFYT